MNHIDTNQTDEETLAGEISDEALESAAGTSAGDSLWTSFEPSGCTC
jgi:hypothetical protein